jgi:hypothetical protein
MKSVMRAVLVGGLAVLAFGAVATASASAYTNPILENAKGEHVSKVKFSGHAIGGTRSVALANKVLLDNYECGPEEGTGELSTTGTGSAAKTSGTATFTFKKCNNTQIGSCKTGETAGEMVYKTSLSLVWLGKESEERLGVLAAIAPESKKPGNGEGGKLKFTCGGTPNELEGGFVALLGVSFRGEQELGEPFTHSIIRASINYPRQLYTQYTEEGIEQESSFWSKFKTEAFETAATEFEQSTTFPETVKIVKS